MFSAVISAEALLVNQLIRWEVSVPTASIRKPKCGEICQLDALRGAFPRTKALDKSFEDKNLFFPISD